MSSPATTSGRAGARPNPKRFRTSSAFSSASPNENENSLPRWPNSRRGTEVKVRSPHARALPKRPMPARRHNALIACAASSDAARSTPSATARLRRSSPATGRRSTNSRKGTDQLSVPYETRCPAYEVTLSRNGSQPWKRRCSQEARTDGGRRDTSGSTSHGIATLGRHVEDPPECKGRGTGGSISVRSDQGDGLVTAEPRSRAARFHRAPLENSPLRLLEWDTPTLSPTGLDTSNDIPGKRGTGDEATPVAASNPQAPSHRVIERHVSNSAPKAGTGPRLCAALILVERRLLASSARST